MGFQLHGRSAPLPRALFEGQLYNQSCRFGKAQVLGLETRVHICLPKLRIPVLPVFLSIGLPAVSAVGLIDAGSKEGENYTSSMQVGVRPTWMDLESIVVYTKRAGFS